MPLLDCYLVRLDPGVTTVPFSTSAHSICTVVEGSGSTTAGSGTVEVGRARHLHVAAPRHR